MTEDSDEPIVALPVSIRHRLLSAGFVFFVAVMVVLHVPKVSTDSAGLGGLQAPIDSLHLHQDWGMFSPNPPPVSIEFWAEVQLFSGEIVRYEYPQPGRWISAYTNTRFRKFERAIATESFARTWQGVAEQIRNEFEQPVERVTLMRTFVTTRIPGSDDVAPEVETLVAVDFELAKADS